MSLLFVSKENMKVLWGWTCFIHVVVVCTWGTVSWRPLDLPEEGQKAFVLQIYKYKVFNADWYVTRTWVTASTFNASWA